MTEEEQSLFKEVSDYIYSEKITHFGVISTKEDYLIIKNSYGFQQWKLSKSVDKLKVEILKSFKYRHLERVAMTLISMTIGYFIGEYT